MVCIVKEVQLVTSKNPHRLDLVLAEGSTGLTPEMAQLWEDIGSTGRVVNRLFSPGRELHKDYFNQLYITADTGLRCENHDVGGGRANLGQVQAEIAEAFTAIRNKYWNAHLRNLGISIASLLIGSVLYFGSVQGWWGLPQPKADQSNQGFFHLAVITGLAIFWIPFGVSLGIFLEFIFSVTRAMNFDQVKLINPGRWHPIQQFVNCLITAAVFAFFLAIGLFQIGVANILLNEFATTKPYLSILVGFVAGFAFPYVREIIYKVRPVTQD